MVKLTVDGLEVDVPAGSNVLQACEAAGREIPRFCYHERLSVAGNCRMCLVEVKPGPPKPMASCALPVAENMQVFTDSEMVRAGRRGVMEFLLINHPLDCPICDQGGECDLQDQSMGYGADHTRYREPKRAVRDKYLGPLVKTVMTRCIQCTRCVRFATEIAGTPELGATARGEAMEITNYVERALTSELSGNLIDICPVGALTSRPYAFAARPWELRKTDSIDVFDALGSAIRVDVRGTEVLRVLPRVHEAVNEEWLADKARFAIDGLKHRRLDRPWLRVGGKLRPAGWTEAFSAISARVRAVPGNRVAAIVGDQCDAEAMLALRDLMRSLGGSIDCRQDGAFLSPARRDHYLFNSGIAGIEQADAILLVGANPRHAAPVLNARLRKAWLAGGLTIAGIGQPVDLTYAVNWLGTGLDTLAALHAGEHPFRETLAGAKRPAIIIGPAALRDPAAAALAWQLLLAVDGVRPDWHGYNVLHGAASRVGALDLGLVPTGAPLARALHGAADLLYLLAADEFDTKAISPDTFVVYQGHHGDKGAAVADVVLPGAAYTEKSGTYVNLEGRVQRGQAAVEPPGEARPDWAILRALSDALGHGLPYGSLDAVRQALEAANPVFGLLDAGPALGAMGPEGPAMPDDSVGRAPLAELYANYYQTDPISRASPTMAECARVAAPYPVAAE